MRFCQVRPPQIFLPPCGQIIPRGGPEPLVRAGALGQGPLLSHSKQEVTDQRRNNDGSQHPTAERYCYQHRPPQHLVIRVGSHINDGLLMVG